jgi:purine-cytosine permease-like protein
MEWAGNPWAWNRGWRWAGIVGVGIAGVAVGAGVARGLPMPDWALPQPIRGGGYDFGFLTSQANLLLKLERFGKGRGLRGVALPR